MKMGLTPEEEERSKKFQIFVGKELNVKIFRVKAKKLIEFAESIGMTAPKYVDAPLKEDGKPDYSKIVAVPTFPNSWTVDACFDMVSWTYPKKEGEEEPEKFIKNFNKVLHTSIEYDYSNAEVPIQHGQKLYTNGILAEVYEKGGKMWIKNKLQTKTKDGKLVCDAVSMVCVREGGY
jgi:hypothetical protein